MKRIGLVGAGYWSQTHLLAWLQVDGASVQCLCDKNEEVLRRRGEQFQIPKNHLYTRLEDMLENEDIDIVDIVTKPVTHRAMIATVAKAGKNMLCQKPFSSSLSEANSIVDILRENGVRLMITENWRWLEPFQQVKKHLENHVVGNIYQVRFMDCKYATPTFVPEKKIPQPYFRTMPNLIFFEMGIHWLDVWRYLFGEPVTLYANAARISPFVQGEDTGVVMLNHDAFFGYMDVSWASRRSYTKKQTPERAEHLIIEGDKATLILYQDNSIVVRDHDANEQVLTNGYPLNMEESFSRLQRHFISCLENGQEFQTNPEDNLKTLELVFAVNAGISFCGL